MLGSWTLWPWLVLAVGKPQPVPEVDEPGWVRERIGRHEDLGVIAERYGVSIEQLRRWNDLPSDPEPGTWLELRPERTPPPQQRRKIKVRKGDTWADVADRHEVTVDQLRGWNPRFAHRRRLPKGAVLTLWEASGVLEYPLPPREAPLAEVTTPTGGVSIGRPHRGRLTDGVQLPHSELYSIRFDRLAYGTSVAVHGIVQAITTFREETGFEGELKIGAMSRRVGRRLRPHRSHQSGRDVDIRLPAMARAQDEARLSTHEVDWFATFALIDAFVRTGVVQVVFLERKFYRRLRHAGMRIGASDQRIAAVMDVVRHSKGHTSHMHIRFICSPTAPNCRD